MAKKHWMKEAFAGSHGQLRAKAESAGESTRQFAGEHAHDSEKLGKQAQLAKIGMKAHHHSPKKTMNKLYS